MFSLRELRLHASTAGGTGLIPSWETTIPNAVQPKYKKKKKTNKANKQKSKLQTNQWLSWKV